MALQGPKCAAAIESSADHHWLSWLVGTTFVVGYSFVISMLVPDFSKLVALVTSGTYLLCAYLIPCGCTLLLLRDRLGGAEIALCAALIGASVLMSLAGCYSALQTLLEDFFGAAVVQA